MDKEAFTTKEAAESLGVSAARVRQMVLDGSLPARKFGRDLVITRGALEAARRRKTSPGPAAKSQSTKTAKASRKSGKK
jgi:excisionase family DNA binding protein